MDSTHSNFLKDRLIRAYSIGITILRKLRGPDKKKKKKKKKAKVYLYIQLFIFKVRNDLKFVIWRESIKVRLHEYDYT